MGLELVLLRQASLHTLMWYSNPIQTAQPEIIADLMFLHERGAYNTLYFCWYFGSLMVRNPNPFNRDTLY